MTRKMSVPFELKGLETKMSGLVETVSKVSSEKYDVPAPPPGLSPAPPPVAPAEEADDVASKSSDGTERKEPERDSSFVSLGKLNFSGGDVFGGETSPSPPPPPPPPPSDPSVADSPHWDNGDAPPPAFSPPKGNSPTRMS